MFICTPFSNRALTIVAKAIGGEAEVGHLQKRFFASGILRQGEQRQQHSHHTARAICTSASAPP